MGNIGIGEAGKKGGDKWSFGEQNMDDSIWRAVYLYGWLIVWGIVWALGMYTWRKGSIVKTLLYRFFWPMYCAVSYFVMFPIIRAGGLEYFNQNKEAVDPVIQMFIWITAPLTMPLFGALYVFSEIARALFG